MRIISIIVFLFAAALVKGQDNWLPEKNKPVSKSYPQSANPQTDSLINYRQMLKIDNNFELPVIEKALQPDSTAIEKQRLDKLLGNYNEFKRKFLALEIKDPMPDIGSLNPYSNWYELKNAAQGSAYGYSVGSPISYLYSQFSTAEKGKKRYAELKKFETSRRIINAKFNYERVKQWTGLQGDSLTAFVLYCHFSDSFLLNTDDYQLIQTVFEKLESFRNTK